MGLGALGELQMRCRGANGRSHTSFLSPVPPSKWGTWFGGSRWWLCGLASNNRTLHLMNQLTQTKKEDQTIYLLCKITAVFSKLTWAELEKCRSREMQKNFCLSFLHLKPTSSTQVWVFFRITIVFWKQTWVGVQLELNFARLIASWSVVLTQFNLTKHKREYLKFGFKCKKERYKHKRKFFASLEFDFFEFSSSLLWKYSRKLG